MGQWPLAIWWAGPPVWWSSAEWERPAGLGAIGGGRDRCGEGSGGSRWKRPERGSGPDGGDTDGAVSVETGGICRDRGWEEPTQFCLRHLQNIFIQF